MRQIIGFEKAARKRRFFVVALVALLSLSCFLVLQAKGSSESATVTANPATLLEVPGEMKVTFQVRSNNNDSPFPDPTSSKVSYHLGETVYLRLSAEFFKEDLPLIANNTIIIVSDDVGNVVWNWSTQQLGGGWIRGGGSQTEIVQWTPEKAGNYTAGVVFEETDYPSDFRNIVSFEVFEPSGFLGKVTELDGAAPISGALIEALQGNEVKANAAADSEGYFAIQIEKAGDYDIRVSASGYIAATYKRLDTKLENTVLNISLAPLNSSLSFNAMWAQEIGDICDADIDSEGNTTTLGGIAGASGVCKFDSNGNLLWNISKSFSGQQELPVGIAVDSNDNILVLVGSQGADFNLYITKLDLYGNEIWTQKFDSVENDFGTDIAADSQDNVVIAGNIYGSTYSGGALAVIKYDSNGTLIWSKISPGFYRINEIISDEENNYVLCGTASSSLTDLDYYLEKIDVNGNVLWNQTFSSNGDKPESGYGVTLDSSGNIVVIGDRFMIKLSANGDEQWLRSLTGKDILAGSNGNIIAIDSSSVEVLNSDGYFLGVTALDEDLRSAVFDAANNLMVVGAQHLFKLSYPVSTSFSSNDSTQQDASKTQLSPVQMEEHQDSSFFILPSIMVAALLTVYFFRKNRKDTEKSVIVRKTSLNLVEPQSLLLKEYS